MKRSSLSRAAWLPFILLPLVTGLGPAAARCAVYRCDGPGSTTFSQFPCPGGDKITLHPAPTVRVPPLSDAEHQRLDALARRSEAESTRRARAADRAAAASRRDRAQRRALCASAREARSALRRERRKGYSLAEARALAERQEELQATLQENC